MQLDKCHQEHITEQFRLHEKDTQSTDIQIAILTERIVLVQEQLDRCPLDRRLRLLLVQLLGRRRRLLAFLAQTDYNRYIVLKKRLNVAA